MKILSRNTDVLKSSLKFSEDGQTVEFQANTELYVEGCTHTDLFTPKTVFGLTCPANAITTINTKASEQVQSWVDVNYNEQQ